MSINNNSDDKKSQTEHTQVRQFHTIPDLADTASVIPETPTPLPQRKNKERVPPQRSLQEFNFKALGATASESHTDQNVSIELSETNLKPSSTESVSQLTVLLGEKQKLSVNNRPGMSGVHTNKTAQGTNPMLVTFDKNIQTSKEKFEGSTMKDLNDFMTNMMVNIKRSHFNLPANEHPASNERNPPTGTLRAMFEHSNPPPPLQRVDVRIFELAKQNWKTL